MKTVSETINWLNSANHVKCILVDISEVRNQTNTADTTFYFSSLPYTPEYNPILQSGLSFTESLSIDASISISYGTIELDNTAGHSDSLLTYVWKRRPIKIYLGDPSWTKSDFVLIFDGLVEDLISTNENSLTISLFDKLQKLNDVLQTRAIKDLSYSESITTSTTRDTVLPLLFGEAFNLQPLYVDNGSTANTGKIYKVHDGNIDDIIEVRDNGVPVPIIKKLSTGEFETASNPQGVLTCTARANATSICTVPELIKIIVKNHGNTTNRFVDADIDFSAVSGNTSKVGLYCKDRLNILDACSQLAKSINAGLVCSSISITGTNLSNYQVTTSKLKLIELKAPTGTSKWNLTDDYMVEGSLSIRETFPVKPTVKLAYCKNYTIQQTVSEGLNPGSNFSEEYLYITNTLAQEQILYRDTGSVEEETTALLITSEASAEAQKRSQLWGTQRFLINATYLPQFIFVQLGDIVSITSNRFSLSSSKQGIIYSVTRNWLTGLVDIGVLV